LPQAFSIDLRLATIIYSIVGGQMINSIHIVSVNFSKIVAYKGTIRKYLNVVAAHIEGLGNPPSAYLTHFFRVNVSLRLNICSPTFYQIFRILDSFIFTISTMRSSNLLCVIMKPMILYKLCCHVFKTLCS
jgi:hypothetical protein